MLLKLTAALYLLVTALVINCKSIIKLYLRLDLDSHYHLQIGMDGPNVNLAFKKNLRKYFEDWFGNLFFNLYHVHFTLSIQHLVKDLSHCHLTWRVSSRIYTFFKLCNARREHYASLESVTKFSAAYAMKHICNQVAFNQVCLCQFS